MSRGIGRPRASSRETLAEAATELFLEQGFDDTSIADIAARAGVSRSSFFNYFDSKSDILWSGLDSQLAHFEASLTSWEGERAVEGVRAAVLALADGFEPDSLALGMVNAAAMGLDDELARESALRRARIARAVADALARHGAERLHAEVAAAAWGGAVLAAIEAWAHDGAGRTSLRRFLARAADIAVAVSPSRRGDVMQLRVVVHAEDFEGALRMYRDAAGMPQSAAYQAEGGARVAILEAGRATLEIANTQQVDFIDRVETDGDAPSDPIRLALEVEDADSAVARLADAGASVEASARATPWRSRNARLRGAAGVQLTVFQELGPES
ncbi:TetR family transcriptional regulator [Microbacterium sp. C7(2022)]|uniref:TetR family transcriptional regulator n=1 Tax=Microbacterium sp. C7(2022) TaxID=2992759 RepID=UPI00237A1783|nr:TetR family transcriptional regulator [Microbacterium sp. C7(2022)]MDE0546888.1 TetR family transcriptional regulator [Microbacterium sp. C7(2022)]